MSIPHDKRAYMTAGFDTAPEEAPTTPGVEITVETGSVTSKGE